MITIHPVHGPFGRKGIPRSFNPVNFGARSARRTYAVRQIIRSIA